MRYEVLASRLQTCSQRHRRMHRKTWSSRNTSMKLSRILAHTLDHQATEKQNWAEAHIKIARMTLTAKLDGNWNSFQLANNTPPLSVTGSVIAPSARMQGEVLGARMAECVRQSCCLHCPRSKTIDPNVHGAEKLLPSFPAVISHRWEPEAPPKIEEVTLMRPFHGNL